MSGQGAPLPGTGSREPSPDGLGPSGFDPSREPMVLIALDDPEQKPKLFACRTCGNAYSVKNVGVQNARDMAINCKDCHPKPYTCDMCGCGTPEYWTRCYQCRYEAKLAAAVEVPDDGGPYCAFNGDTYYHELEEAEDAGLDWVSPCTVTYPRIDADSVLENLLDDMFEDASTDDLDATEPFYEAVDAFNKAQTTRSYFGDDKRKIRVPKRDSDRSGEAGETVGLDPKGDSAGLQGIAPPSPSPQENI